MLKKQLAFKYTKVKIILFICKGQSTAPVCHCTVIQIGFSTFGKSRFSTLTTTDLLILEVESAVVTPPSIANFKVSFKPILFVFIVP